MARVASETKANEYKEEWRKASFIAWYAAAFERMDKMPRLIEFWDQLKLGDDPEISHAMLEREIDESRRAARELEKRLGLN